MWRSKEEDCSFSIDQMSNVNFEMISTFVSMPWHLLSALLFSPGLFMDGETSLNRENISLSKHLFCKGFVSPINPAIDQGAGKFCITSILSVFTLLRDLKGVPSNGDCQ